MDMMNYEKHVPQYVVSLFAVLLLFLMGIYIELSYFIYLALAHCDV